MLEEERAGWGRASAAPPAPHAGSCSRNGGFKLFFFVGEYACGLNYLYAALISPKCFIGIRQIRESEMDAPGGAGAGRDWRGAVRSRGKLI